MPGLPLEFKHLLNGEVVGYEIRELGFHDAAKKHYKTWFFEPGQRDGEWRKNPPFISNEIRQYTRFKDKNGGKIYFGDELISPDDSFGIDAEFEVKISYGEISCMYKSFSLHNEYFQDMELVKCQP